MENLEQVFNAIVKKYSERLYWHVRRMVGTHEDADDLLQDIFLKIWTALPSFRGEAQLYTWVWRIATIKPLDEKAIIASAKKTGCVVVAEEHNMAGGLGEAVAGVLARELPTPVVFVNGEDKFGQSGTPSALMAAYGLDAPHIAEAARKALARK